MLTKLFAHHIGVEFFGHEFAPETPLEHVVGFGITGICLGLILYGAYAGWRDLRRWLRGPSPAAELPGPSGTK